MSDTTQKTALPDSVTTYDILKSLAVIIMVIDHIGFYFEPTEHWWRAVGRIGFPVWFFLIGYARSRKIDYSLIGGALILIAADFILLRPMFALNALVTMVLLRTFVNPIMKFVGDDETKLFAITVAACIFFPITSSYFEYGTLGFLFAFCGYLARNNFKGKTTIPHLYGVFCLIFFVVTQHNVFHFTPVLDAFNAIGSAAMIAALFFYLPRKENIGFTVNSRAVQKTLRFLGSRTLEIYVIHLVLFKLIFAYQSGCVQCDYLPHFNVMSLVS